MYKLQLWCVYLPLKFTELKPRATFTWMLSKQLAERAFLENKITGKSMLSLDKPKALARNTLRGHAQKY
jgi:hypothetical protein